MARAAARFLAGALLCAAAPATAQLRVTAVPISGRAAVDSLARLGFEVAELREIGGRLHAIVVASPETGTLLAQRGYTATPLARAAAADTFRVFHSFDKPVAGIRATLEAWDAGDTLMHVDSVGASIEGRPILGVKIGPAADDPSRPNVLFMGTHHAREWISTAVAMRLIRWLADSGGAAVVANDVWVIPVENPDGYQYTFTAERYWRKNRRPNGDGTFGVDPNRNYPAFWGLDDAGSSGWTLAETYRGASPGSEPETQAIMAFHAAHPPVVSVSYHSYSGLVLYPYGFRTGVLPPDLTRYQTLAGTDLAPAVRDSVPGSLLEHYHPGPGWNLYVTNGEYTDWAYRAHGTIAFTTELTSGCCVQDLYYGFEFPDDSALVERVFRDNLPFALSLIAAAGNLATAPGVSGLLPGMPQFTSLFPESWLSLDASAPRPATLTLRAATGALGSRGTQADSLDRGTLRTTWRTDLGADNVRALRADGTGVSAELLLLAGAEPQDAAWVGWTREPGGLAGTHAWTTTASDTLTSPSLDLSGRNALWLHLWTRHRGSTFTPAQRGLIQVSGDSGGTWTDVAVIAGDGPSWYPVRVELPQATGRRGVRVRFISENAFWWSVDAVGLATDSTVAFDQLAAGDAAEVSENPVRGDQVVISWPTPSAGGVARVSIHAFTGERLHTASVAAPSNEYVWDLMLGGARRVVNGGYIIVVEVNGQRYRRRLFVARPHP